MATYKIMLVEDDNNLRAIYGDRLLAEGYEIVAARDGEEALAMAVKEKPNLIISDVMMPKISGFDMLDILRTTPETKDVKVIMMTALSQAEDKLRADKLGADKYLVKSQVTLEDVTRVVHEVLGDMPAEAQEPVATPAPDAQSPTPIAVAPAPAPLVAPVPTTDPMGMTPAPIIADPPVSAPVVAVDPMSVPAIPVVEVSQESAESLPASTAGATTGGQRVIQPISPPVDPNTQPRIYELYEKEIASQNANSPVTDTPTVMVAEPPITPVSQPQTAPVSPTTAPPAPGQSFDPNSVAL